MYLIHRYQQMEVLLFALFFISALIFFILGKDDFGRTKSKLIIKEETTVKDEEKKEVTIAKKEDIEPEEQVLNEKEKIKVAEKGEIESQEGIKKDS